MARRRTRGPTEREAEILAILWDAGESTVERIRHRLPEAPTAATVRRLLRIMVERGLVAVDGGRAERRYRAAAEPAQFQGAAAGRLLDTLFGGAAEALVVCLVDSGRITPAALGILSARLQRPTAAVDTGAGGP